MNKIFLKKSFAGYPVWEYVYNNGEYFHSMHSTHSIHKDIVEWMKDHFEEVKERPTSWEELWEIEWYYISWDPEATAIDTCRAERWNIDVFKTQEQAEASIALAQITQLLDKYDIPEKSDVWYHKNWHDYSKAWLLHFDTKEKRDHFYKHHSDLISKLAPFYIF